MFPWLAHGHISPFIELSKRLAKNKFKIYFCSTEINLNFIKESKSFDENSSDHSIELVRLDLPDFPELPPHYHTTKNLPPHLTSTLKLAFRMSKPSFSNILNTLKPDLLIYDVLQSWAAELAAFNSIPSVLFLIIGAANISFFYHGTNCRVSGTNETYPFSEIFFRDYEMKKIIATYQELTKLESEEAEVFKCFELSSDIVLVKSWTEIEGRYIDHLSLCSGKKVVSVGPLNNQDDDTKEEEEQEDNSHIIKFLNSKDESSVVYVSFGSEYFLSKEEREEIAYGLELSNANFIWLVRFPMGHAVALQEALPEGFLHRVKERGIVVDGWAPQAKILQHSNTGGFLSHCGWGSVMESIYDGVPLLALPMQHDQPLNARLVVDVGFGIEILRDEDGQIKREEVAKVINMVVVEKTKAGELLTQKARERVNS
ncbi:mogroside IIIx synthase-like [Coffea arabica]|uniref:Glycosyltransferase n=1 Tax=Coffea arabica TaxID=13443 RepID=A0ABM4USC8_COFAR